MSIQKLIAKEDELQEAYDTVSSRVEFDGEDLDNEVVTLRNELNDVQALIEECDCD